MKIAVWDTYVQRHDGKLMHFDILVPDSITDEQTVVNYGKAYLKTKDFQTNQLSANECRLCHIKKATEKLMTSIDKKGYHIIEMENCN